MKRHFKDLVNYNNWANERVLQTLEEHADKEETLLNLYGHIISSQIVWLLRIRGLPTSPFPLWQSYNIVELRSMTEESSRNWVNYLEAHKFDTFEEMIHYTNSQAVKHESTIREIINQMLGHGNYHRGQIALQMRKNQLKPVQTDYILYKRLS